jgi:ribosomal protein S6--L-glutamate ligase
MTPHIGVLTVQGKDYHPTARFTEAAAARGAVVVPINPYDVQPAYHKNRPILQGDPDASSVQAVLPRQGAEIKTACLPLIAHYEQMGVRVINGLHAIQIARNKFFMLQALTRADLPVPNTLFAPSLEGCRQARHFFSPDPVVLKPISGRQGTGLHCLSPGDATPQDIEAQLTSGRGVLVQAYIPAAQRRDFRVFVIGREVAGAISLQPPDGDFRVNVHIGGLSTPIDLSPEMADMAVRAAAAMELEIAGVDLIVGDQSGPAIIEVNSSPGFRSLEATTGKDIAGAVVDYALSVI